MKICIDARMYGPRVGGGGLGRYVQEVILELQKQDQENEYVVLLKQENFGECPIPNKRWTKVRADIHWYSLQEQTRLPRLIDMLGCDLVHFPHFNVPLRLRTPFVVTIHDLIMLDQKRSAQASTRGPLLFALKRFGYRKTLFHAARNAKRIVTVSEHAKGQIVDRLNVPAKKVHVVYNGVKRTDVPEENTNTKSPKGTHGLPTFSGPFFLNVGNAYPHKNLITLLHTFSFFVRTYPDAHLVLVGPRNTFSKRLEREAREIDIPPEKIHFLGFVDETQLSWLYSNATGYVIPSKVEGFGMPPLEALDHGTPVAASRASCIPEILADAAIYFNPDDVEDLFQAMETLLNDKQAVTRLLTKRHEVLGRYSWSAHAQALQDIYQLATHAA